MCQIQSHLALLLIFSLLRGVNRAELVFQTKSQALSPTSRKFFRRTMVLRTGSYVNQNEKKKNRGSITGKVLLAILCLLFVHGILLISDPSKSLGIETSINACTTKNATTAVTSKRGTAVFNSSIRFLFIIGLEGTGHHAIGNIYHKSPARKQIQDWEIHPRMSLELEVALFEDDNLGFFNLHCGNRSQIQMQDAVAHRNKVVQKLQQINQKAAAQASDDTKTTTMLMNAYHGVRVAGEMSYPNFIGECRKLNFPNIDLLYHACDLAKVDCAHVFLYREPYAILRSTGDRGFHDSIKSQILGRRAYHDTMVTAIHMYTSMLSIIQTQLWTHRHRTLGCWSILDPTEDIWQSIQKTFGWESRIEMAKTMREIYRNPKQLDDEEKEQIAPAIYSPYMDSFFRHHEDSVELCRQQAAVNTYY